MCNGNHRFNVLKELSETDSKFKKAFCFNLGKITEQQAKRIALETNETSFESDTDKMYALLIELKENFSLDELKETMPFDDFQWQSLEALTQDEGIADYSLLDDDNSSDVEDTLNNQNENLRRAIQIDFSLENYQICFDLIKTIKQHKLDIGTLLIEKLISVKENLEGNT